MWDEINFKSVTKCLNETKTNNCNVLPSPSPRTVSAAPPLQQPQQQQQLPLLPSLPGADLSSDGVQLTLTVPPTVLSGHNVTLRCEHRAARDSDELYSLKWYKQRSLGETHGREFVRYTPKEIPAVKIFPLHGVTVDVSSRSE